MTFKTEINVAGLPSSLVGLRPGATVELKKIDKPNEPKKRERWVSSPHVITIDNDPLDLEEGRGSGRTKLLGC